MKIANNCPFDGSCVSLDHTKENQINHIFISKTFKRFVEYSRTKKVIYITADQNLVVG